MNIIQWLVDECARRPAVTTKPDSWPKDCKLTPQERHESAVRMRSRMSKNIIAKGGVAGAH